MREPCSPQPVAVAPPAASADPLALLAKFARVDDEPSTFLDLCDDWARQIDHMRANPAFDLVVKRLCAARGQEAAPGLAMIIDRNGTVTGIADLLARQFAVSVGDNIAASLEEGPAELLARAGERAILTEFHDRAGMRHLISVRRLGEAEEYHDRLSLALCQIALPPSAERYLKSIFNLTGAELDILKLLVQGADITAAAAARGNAVNTIRTHINSIIRKFGCNSLNAVITSVFEIVYFSEDRAPGYEPAPSDDGADVLSHDFPDGTQLHYRRGGAPGGRAMLLLHSLEFGHRPPTSFFDSARQHGFEVIAPKRPGFGGSPPCSHHMEAARFAQLLEALGLHDVTLVPMGTASPVGLDLGARSSRIAQTVLVNYGFNSTEKMRNLRPSWLPGLVDLVVSSPDSLNFAARCGRRMIRTLGVRKFMAALFENSPPDQAFLAAHPELAAVAVEIFLTASASAVAADMRAAFRHNPEIEAAVPKNRSLIVIRGGDGFNACDAAPRAEAARFGVPFHRIEDAGKFCVFQKPDVFFDLVASRMKARAALV